MRVPKNVFEIEKKKIKEKNLNFEIQNKDLENYLLFASSEKQGITCYFENY